MRRASRLWSAVAVPTLALTLIGCGSDSAVTGTFPNIVTLVKQVAPYIAATRDASAVREASPFAHVLPAVRMPASYNNPETDWSGNGKDYRSIVKLVLGDPAESSTSSIRMLSLLLELQSFVNVANTTYSDESGGLRNCTDIASTTTVKMPYNSTWLANSTDANKKNSLLVDINETGVFTCKAKDFANGTLLLGRKAVSDPPSDCTDKFQYSLMLGQVVQDGGERDGVFKFHYNGCTKALKVSYVYFTKNSSNVFSSTRMELSGTTTDHSFEMRSTHAVDINSTSSTPRVFTVTGKGNAYASSGKSYFVLEYGQDAAPFGAPSSEMPDTFHGFCQEAGTTAGSFSPVAYSLTQVVANNPCKVPETTFGNINHPYGYGEIPTAVFTVNDAAFGL